LERHDRDTAAGKGAIVAELLPAIAATTSQTERESFIRRLARQLQVSDTAVYADLAKSGLWDSAKLPHQPTIPRHQPQEHLAHPAQRQLLALALFNKRIFAQVMEDLPGIWDDLEKESQLISIVTDLGEQYDFQMQSLFNYLPEENEGLRQFMLKLLETDIETDDEYALADSYIAMLKQQRIKEQIAKIQNDIAIAEANNQDCRELLAEKIRLTNLLHQN
jgi:DNA primase